MDRSKDGRAEGSITTGADFLQLNVAQAPPGGLADWLTECIRAAIADGRLVVRSRLPASRLLAADLGVSRGVVTEVYRRLTEDGQVQGRGRAGTVVVGPFLGSASRYAARAVGTAVPMVVSERATSGVFDQPPGARTFEALRAAPGRIDLSPGVPDLDAFPRAAWLRAERAVLRDLASSALGYGDAQGTPTLRAAVASWLARSRGIRVGPDGIVIVTGVAQALGLLAQMFRHDGISAIAVEDPGSLGTRQQLQAFGLATPPVPVDAGGLVVDQLQASGARAVLVTPAHQFPTGVVLDGERRRQLLAWADAGGVVVEDDYDAEHRYDRPPVPALRSVRPDRVFYAGSVSKTLAPALRIGWIVPPAGWVEAVTVAKRYADLGNAVLPQLVLAELMTTGQLERHLRTLRRRHRARRDAMIGSLARHLPGAQVHGAAAGLHLTVTFEGDLDDTALAAAALRVGVKVQPLAWHRQRPGPPGLVLGYAATTPGEIDDGIAVLGRLVGGE